MGRANLILLFIPPLSKWKNGGKAYPKISQKIKKGMISHSFVKEQFCKNFTIGDPDYGEILRGFVPRPKPDNSAGV